MYIKCINFWVIVLIIIMTFCLTHQNQINYEGKENYTKEISNDTNVPKAIQIQSYENPQTASTQSNISMIEGSIGDSKSLDSNSTLKAISYEDLNASTIRHNKNQLALSESNQHDLKLNRIYRLSNQKSTETLSASATSISLYEIQEITTQKGLYLNLSEVVTNGSTATFSNHTVINKTNKFESTNMNNDKSSKHRGAINILEKSINVTTGIQNSSQKIEMPHLNNFFDHTTFLRKHENGFRYGPHFETGNVTNITVQAGSTFYLHCRISLLQDKTVSWVRRKCGENELELLTVGRQTYSGDPRYSVEFQYPNNWRLKIIQAQKVDEATYECQISTSPPRFIHYNVRINAPTVSIVDEQGIPLLDKYYEVDSTIKLTCIIRHISMMSSVVFWMHNSNSILNYDTTRGGISVRTDLMEIGANSTLLVAKVNTSDAGNYTCTIGDSQYYTVFVHVLNEESLAELHHSGYHLETWKQVMFLQKLLLIALFIIRLEKFVLVKILW